MTTDDDDNDDHGDDAGDVGIAAGDFIRDSYIPFIRYAVVAVLKCKCAVASYYAERPMRSPTGGDATPVLVCASYYTPRRRPRKHPIMAKPCSRRANARRSGRRRKEGAAAVFLIARSKNDGIPCTFCAEHDTPGTLPSSPRPHVFLRTLGTRARLKGMLSADIMRLSHFVLFFFSIWLDKIASAYTE